MALSKIDPAGLDIGQIGGRRNLIINGAAIIDQRNTASSAFTAQSGYHVDRWKATRYATDELAWTIQQVTDAPANFKNSIKLTVTTAETDYSQTIENTVFQTNLEGQDIAHLGFGTSDAQVLTLSFWIKASIAGIYGGGVVNSAGDRSYPFSYTVSATNTWEYKTVTFTADTTGTWLTTNGVGLQLVFGLGQGSDRLGTAGAWTTGTKTGVTGQVQLTETLNATWQITGVQLEVGSVATPFEHRSYGEELALCQRYFWRTTGDDFAGIGSGSVRDSTGARAVIVNPTTMRAKPSISISGTLRGSAGGSNLTITEIAASWPGKVSNMTQFVVSGATAGQGFIIHHIDNTSNYFQCDAEL